MNGSAVGGGEEGVTCINDIEYTVGTLFKVLLKITSHKGTLIEEKTTLDPLGYLLIRAALLLVARQTAAQIFDTPFDTLLIVDIGVTVAVGVSIGWCSRICCDYCHGYRL